MVYPVSHIEVLAKDAPAMQRFCQHAFGLRMRPPANDCATVFPDSGDTQGLSNAEQANSESVEELAADGQSLEAAAVSGVEDADDPDVHEVQTREVPQDDVPREYDEQ